MSQIHISILEYIHILKNVYYTHHTHTNYQENIMKKLLLILTLLFTPLAATSTYASDFFGGNNNGEWKMGPNGPYWDESDWPEWTPMYWMEEFMDSFDDDDNWGSNFGGYNRGGNYYGNPYGGYNQAPYGYGNPYGGYGYPQVPVVPAQ